MAHFHGSIRERADSKLKISFTHTYYGLDIASCILAILIFCGLYQYGVSAAPRDISGIIGLWLRGPDHSRIRTSIISRLNYSMSSFRLLQLAIPLVGNYGFTREALARSVLALPPSEAHTQPLSETAVSAIFGSGDIARITLINAWLDDGITKMRSVPAGSSMKDVLRSRLERNEPVLQHLPEAFAVLSISNSAPFPLDPRPIVSHAAKIADEACHVTGDASLQLAWYTRRASLTAIYSATELHQLTSPSTAYSFLDSLLGGSASLKSSLDEVDLFSSYIVKSCAGIIKSSGIF